MLRIIGQIALMKITQIDAGSAASNTSRPIGSQASGETGRSRLMIGASMLARKAKRPMAKPSGMPTSAARPKPIADPAQRVEDVPADAHVVGAVVVEGVGEQQ